MKTNAKNHSPRLSGFSLVELLLTLVLILCLAAASVFCYTAIHRQSTLNEGADRLQSIIRFARAEAATSGRKIRINFETAREVDTEIRSDLKRIRVTWEPDFLTAPGVFQTYTNKAWSEELVNELVGVEEVRSLDAEAAPKKAETFAEDPNLTTDPEVEADLEEEAVDEELEYGEEFPAITFYPDGSSDSAEIIIASRDEEDPRKMAVAVSGILGSVSTRVVTEDDGDGAFDENGQPREESEPEFETVQEEPVSALPTPELNTQ